MNSTERASVDLWWLPVGAGGRFVRLNGRLFEGLSARVHRRERVFRYEIRRWRDGRIPDAGEAVESPVGVSVDPRAARRLLESVAAVPPLVWGRDELGTGEMWNSNAIVAWLLERSGIDAGAIDPPVGGRAPGWRAGILAAQRAR